MISIPPKGDGDKRVGAYFTPLQVNAQALPDMTVNIQPGSYWSALAEHIEYIGGNSPVLSAPSADAKWVVIVLNENGLLDVLNGIPSTNPDLPSIPETVLPIAGIFIGDTATVITNDMVFDIRPLWSIRPENIPNLAGELADRPTTVDMNAALALKADMAGTNSDIFTLNQDQVGVTSTDVTLEVERGAEPNVAIRWNETAEYWEFTNDGTVYSPIGMSAGSFYTQAQLDGGVLDTRYYTETESDGLFAPIVHTHTSSDITDFVSAVQALSPVISVAGKLGAVTLVEADITDLDKYPTVSGAVTGNIVTFGAAGMLTDSGFTTAGFALTAHTHVAADVTDFSTATTTILNASSVNEMSDVILSGVTDGQALVYNSGSVAFINKFLSTDELSDVNTSGVVSGDVMVHNGTFFDSRALLKSDVSDFSDTDYVLTTGSVAQNVTGAKTFDDLLTATLGITSNGPVNLNNQTFNTTSTELMLNFGLPADDAGISVDRTPDLKARMYWDEVGTQWMAGPVAGLYHPVLLGSSLSTQPDYVLVVGTGLAVYTTTMMIGTPVVPKEASQVFVNGIKQVRGATKAYTETYSPLEITFNVGSEPAVSDDVEIYGFGTTS